MAEIVEHVLELPISFEDGSGVTSRMSQAEVRFATEAPLAPGQQVAGTIGFPQVDNAPGAVLRYVAEVTQVLTPRPGRRLEVVARFEQIGLAQPSRRI